jgi:RNA polymerase sigma-70 factor (ECF subfamily)
VLKSPGLKSSGVSIADRDDALMARLAARAPDAFRLLISQHAKPAHRIAWRMLGEASEAEDVVQEALLKLWQQADKWIAGGQGIAPWLARVTTNLCIDRLRRIRPATGVELPERIDDAPGADASVDEERVRALTHDALLALPERQRAAIILTYFEDYSNACAAEALDMNIKAFESLLLRSRKALRVLLSARGLLGWEAER